MEHNDQKKFAPVLALLILAALAGMALVAYATTHGPGVGGDATIYLTSAQNLIAGKGLGWTEADGSFRLLPYTPPFYPLMLSMVGLVVEDILAGARWLNILLFGILIVWMGWSFYRATNRLWLAGLLSALLATSPVIIGVQVWAMAESLTLFLGFAGFVLLLSYLDCPRPGTFFVSALLVGLSFLSRYIAVSFVATACLVVLWMNPGLSPLGPVRKSLWPTWENLRKAVGYGLVAILPMLIWLVVDYSITGTVGSRSGQPASAYWQRFLEIGPALQNIYLFWLLPESIIPRLPGFVQVALWLLPLAGLVGLALWISRRISTAPMLDVEEPAAPLAPAVRMADVFGLFILVYLVVLTVVQVFTYPPITLASRMLVPVHFAVLVLLLVLVHLGLRLITPSPRIPANVLRWLPAGLYLVGLAVLGSYSLRGYLIARDYHQTGIGYTSPAWRDSNTISVLKDIPRSTPIISNETTAVMFLTGRPAYPLQEIYQTEPQKTYTVYGAGKDESQRAFREQEGALVLFESTLYEDFAMYGDEVEARLQALTRDLYPFYQGDDGSIYFHARPAFLAVPCL